MVTQVTSASDKKQFSHVDKLFAVLPWLHNETSAEKVTYQGLNMDRHVTVTLPLDEQHLAIVERHWNI